MITLRPELLAPAGDHDALLAALTAGADAVYLGVKDFNARRNAPNFTLDTLQEACDLAHLAGRRIYLTLNTMVLPDELNHALDIARRAYEIGVDALIVQDLGLLARLALEMPRLTLHASTQMNIHNSAGVRLAAELGASRITLSRELSLEEISQIAKTGIPLEVFAHGALCVCYSGQCLFSSLVGRRSANRGLCAQACRLPYQLIDTSTGRRVKTPGEHLLSPADLATIDILPALIDSGIAALKIEGRMKSAAYVATVTKVYREALDRLCGVGAVEMQDRLRFEVNAEEILAETFSRGFTTAYLKGERGNDMMSYSRPNNQGVAVGRVIALEKGLVSISLTKRVTRGDVLEFRTSRGQSTVRLERFWDSADQSRETLDEAEAGTRIFLSVSDPVGKGDRVFRVRSMEMLDNVESTFGSTVFQGNNGLVDMTAEVFAHLGQKLLIRFSVIRGPDRWYGEATGETLQPARTKALTHNEVREHVGRVGGTPFSIGSWDIHLDEGVGLSFSELHRKRSEALDNLVDTMLQPWQQRHPGTRVSQPALAPARKGKPRVAAVVRDEAGLKAAVQSGAELLYLHSLRFDADDLSRVSTILKLPTKTPITRILPAITFDRELPSLLDGLNGCRAAVANNLAEVDLLKGSVENLEAGPSLGICNAEALALLTRLGLTQAWLSPELSCRDIARISPDAPLPLVLTIIGRQEVMITEHCILMAQGPCDQHCDSCVRRKAPRLLEDRKGYRFPVRTDDQGRSHLFNAVALDLVPSMPELVSLGISTFVVDGTLLTTKELKAEVERAVRARDLAIRGAGSLPKREGYTTGHFFRGVY